MKPATEKKLNELYNFINNSHFFEQEHKDKIKLKIAEILACEVNDVKLGNFDIYNLIDKEEAKLRPFCDAVHYINGYLYATDTHILLKLKSEYSSELEGKSIKNDGSEINRKDCTLPNFENVLQNNFKHYNTRNDFTIDFDKVSTCLKQAKAHKKIYKKIAKCCFKLNDVYVDVFLFEKFCKVLKHFDVNTIKIGDKTQIIMAKNHVFELMLCPIYPPDKIEDNILILDL